MATWKAPNVKTARVEPPILTGFFDENDPEFEKQFGIGTIIPEQQLTMSSREFGMTEERTVAPVVHPIPIVTTTTTPSKYTPISETRTIVASKSKKSDKNGAKTGDVMKGSHKGNISRKKDTPPPSPPPLPPMTSESNGTSGIDLANMNSKTLRSIFLDMVTPDDRVEESALKNIQISQLAISINGTFKHLKFAIWLQNGTVRIVKRDHWVRQKLWKHMDTLIRTVRDYDESILETYGQTHGKKAFDKTIELLSLLKEDAKHPGQNFDKYMYQSRRSSTPNDLMTLEEEEEGEVVEEGEKKQEPQQQQQQVTEKVVVEAPSLSNEIAPIVVEKEPDESIVIDPIVPVEVVPATIEKEIVIVEVVPVTIEKEPESIAVPAVDIEKDPEPIPNEPVEPHHITVADEIISSNIIIDSTNREAFENFVHVTKQAMARFVSPLPPAPEELNPTETAQITKDQTHHGESLETVMDANELASQQRKRTIEWLQEIPEPSPKRIPKRIEIQAFEFLMEKLQWCAPIITETQGEVDFWTACDKVKENIIKTLQK